MKKYNKFFVFGFLLLGGCTTHQIAKPLSHDLYLGKETQKMPSEQYKNIELAKWWLSFNDPVLNNLINIAIANNYDIKQSIAKIEEARAFYNAQVSAKLPQGSVSTSTTVERMSENGVLPLKKLPGFERDQVLFQYGYDASWEIDVFGSVRNKIDMANANIGAMQYAAYGARISVISEIARLYFELNSTSEQINVANQYIETLDQTIGLLNERYKHGDIARINIDDALAKRAIYKTQIPMLENKRRSLAIIIASLLGQPPEATNYLLNMKPKPARLFAFPIGARDEILKRRPDILAAEAKLQATASDYEAQKAELYPHFIISANAGWQSVHLSKMFDKDSQSASIMPFIKWNIFNGGRVNAEIKAADERQKQALDAYSQSVIDALSDSSRALSDYKSNIDVINVRNDAVKAQTDFYNRQVLRLKAGDVSRFEVLDAKRSMLDLQMQDIVSHSQATTSLISLIKALGGGWS